MSNVSARLSHSEVVSQFKTAFGYSDADGSFTQDARFHNAGIPTGSSDAARLERAVDSRRSPWDSVDFFSIDVGNKKTGSHPLLVAEAQNQTGEEALVRFYTPSGKTRIADLRTSDFRGPEWVVYK